MRSDNDPALLALKESLAQRLRVMHGARVVMEESARYDLQSNGAAESAVKMAKGAARTRLHDLASRGVLGIRGGHPMVPWAVSHAAAMHARHQRGPDGRTAFESRRGKEYNIFLPPLGEQILFA